MNILGIGTDLVQQNRVKGLLARFGARFIERILSSSEQKIFYAIENREGFLAKRFAGKEAIAKAFGVGIGAHMRFNEISIENHDNGKPYVVFSGNALNFAKKSSMADIMISLSDEKEYALAFVIILASTP